MMSLTAAEEVVIKDALGLLNDGLTALAPLAGANIAVGIGVAILRSAIATVEALLPATSAS
jgi:hypothetical protein